MNEIITKDEHYIYLVEQIKATVNQAVTNSRWFLIEGYWNVGKLIREEFAKNITDGLRGLAVDVGIGERTLWYALQFYDTYPDINTLPEGNNISWTKIITKYLSKTKDKPLDDFGGAYVKLDRFLKYVKDIVSESAYREFEHWGEKGRLLLEDYDSRRTVQVEMNLDGTVLEEGTGAAPDIVIRGHQHDDWIDNTDLVIGS